MAGLTVAASLITTARVSGPVWDYVVRWWWVTAALVWISILWSAIELIGRADVRRWLGWAALAVAAMLAMVLSWRAVPVQLPDGQLSTTAGRLAATTANELDPAGRYLIHFADVRFWGSVSNGVFLGLDERGFDVAASAEQVPPFERWRTRPETPGWTDLYVVGEDDLTDGFRVPGRTHVVAHDDPLTPAQRRSRRRAARAPPVLGAATDPTVSAAAAVDDATINGSVLTPAEIGELRELRAIGFAYTVFEVDAAE